MVAGPKGVPIIGVVAFLFLFGSSCSLDTATPTASPTTQISPHIELSPTPPPATAVYSLPPQGLNLHSAPGREAPSAATVRQGVQLDVLAAQQLGLESWIHVRAHDRPDVDGWALRDPLLETGTPVELSVDTVLGYSILFPKGWTAKEDSSSQRSFAAAAAGGRLVIQVAADLEKLPTVPTSPGQAEREEGPVEVYGKSPLVTVYRLTSGGYELSVRFLWVPGRAFQLNFSAPVADSTLFKQIIVSMTIQ